MTGSGFSSAIMSSTTSLPTENFFYRLMRVIFRKTKPPDHFRSAREVEDYLKSQDFRKVSASVIPFSFQYSRSSGSASGPDPEARRTNLGWPRGG